MVLRRGSSRLGAGVLSGVVLALGLARAAELSLARVGPRVIDAPRLLARAAQLAPFQRARFGTSWPEQRRRFLEQQLVREALLEVKAADEDRRLASARDRALASALISELGQRLEQGGGVPASEVADYYAEHRQNYEEPRSILIWRILVRQEAEARALLHELVPPTEATWSRLARERSLDTATNMRSGSLGFVAADGQTHMPQLRVSPALFAAADRVRDGQLVPQPVAEGEGFAVIWRRASHSAQPNQLAAVSGDIRALLLQAKLTSELETLTQRLRQQALRDHQPALLAGFEPRAPEALEPVRSAPVQALARRPVPLTPRTTDSGLR